MRAAEPLLQLRQKPNAADHDPGAFLQTIDDQDPPPVDVAGAYDVRDEHLRFGLLPYFADAVRAGGQRIARYRQPALRMILALHRDSERPADAQAVRRVHNTEQYWCRLLLQRQTAADVAQREILAFRRDCAHGLDMGG